MTSAATSALYSSKLDRIRAAEQRRERMMRRATNPAGAVGTVLTDQRHLRWAAGVDAGALGLIGGKGALDVLGPALEGVRAPLASRDVMAAAGMRDSGNVLRGLPKAAGVADQMRRASVERRELFGVGRGMVCAPRPYVTRRATQQVTEMVSAGSMRGLHDVGAAGRLARAYAGTGGQPEILSERLAHIRQVCVAALPRLAYGPTDARQARVAQANNLRHVLRLTDLGSSELRLLAGLTRGSAITQAFTAGVMAPNEQAALRRLSDVTTGRALASTLLGRDASVLQHLAQDAMRTRRGTIGMRAAMRTTLSPTDARGVGLRTPLDGIGVLRARDLFVGVHRPWEDTARIADLRAPRVDFRPPEAMTAQVELIVPADGDVLDAVGLEVVPAGGLDGEVVRSGTVLDAALGLVWCNPLEWRAIWPRATTHERTSLRQKAAAVAAASGWLSYGVITGNMHMVVSGVVSMALACWALGAELEKLRDEQGAAPDERP